MSKSKKKENTQIIRGYKVFNSDWICSPGIGVYKQYSCPGKFEEKVDPIIRVIGMHFCKTLADCFHYYSFDPTYKVAEVIAYGTVSERDDICCTDKLEIVREIPWSEVLNLVNSGLGCTGINNSGDSNAGDRNTGDLNTGKCNIGNYNVGDANGGNFNVGDYNLGNYNTGQENAGNKNTGNFNKGHCNSGNCNLGNGNTGNNNLGNNNTGDYNISSCNTGCFNTIEHKIMMFNQPSDWTYSDWTNSEAYRILQGMPQKETTKYIWYCDMTDKEKEDHPESEITHGYLKVTNNLKTVQGWWNKLPKSNKNAILSLPNFDADIFHKCTGIDVKKSKE